MPLSPRQARAYTHSVNVWRATVEEPGVDGKFEGRSWSQVGTAVRCHVEMHGGPHAPQAGLVLAEDQDLITMDKFHFALDADLKMSDEVEVRSGALAGQWWKLVEEPEVREWRANKQQLMAIRIEAPSPGAG